MGLGVQEAAQNLEPYQHYQSFLTGVFFLAGDPKIALNNVF
jgi:hypothetical protein